MDSTYTRSITRSAVRPVVLLFGLLAACSTDSAPTAPAAVTAPSLGVNNGGNNRRILFAKDGAIYSMNPDGSGVAQVTRPEQSFPPAMDRSPAWSPDGKRIAFVRMGGDDGAGEIYVVNADGTALTRLTVSPGNDLTPTWSKDGKRIAFVSTRGDVSPSTAGSQAWDIYAMNAADGSGVVRLTDRPGADFDPAWSPDGKQVAFASGRDGGDQDGSDLYVLTLDGLQVTRLTAEGTHVREPSWAPGGKQIAFSAGNIEAGETDLFVIDISSRQLTRLTEGPDGPGADASPSWSPDGKQIAFASTRAAGTNEIYIMTSSGTAVTRLTFNSAEDLEPAWNR